MDISWDISRLVRYLMSFSWDISPISPDGTDWRSRSSRTFAGQLAELLFWHYLFGQWRRFASPSQWIYQHAPSSIRQGNLLVRFIPMPFVGFCLFNQTFPCQSATQPTLKRTGIHPMSCHRVHVIGGETRYTVLFSSYGAIYVIRVTIKGRQ